ncbi:MAG: Hsp20/alpha crystallin family protein [Myxococcota bacterium]
MPEIIKKEIPSTPVTTWDPFQEMRSLLSWEPFRNLRMNAPELNFAPAFEVKETKDGFLFKADVPGVKENDIEISLTGDRLVISGKREAEKTEKNETLYTYERTYGSFQRAFTLPQGVDAEHARAELKDGVLTVLLPRVAAEQPKKIVVKAGEKAKI